MAVATENGVEFEEIRYTKNPPDEATLRELDVKKNSKIMLVGSTVTDVLSVSAPDMKTLKEDEKKEQASGKEPLSKQKVSNFSTKIV